MRNKSINIFCSGATHKRLSKGRTTGNVKEYDDDGIASIFSILQKEYEGEDSRNKQMETKSQVLLAVSGIFASPILLLLKALIECKICVLIGTSILLVSMLLLVIAMLYFLNVFSIQKFKHINYEALTIKEHQLMPKSKIQYCLTHDYGECIKRNREIADAKAKNIKYGSRIIFVSIILFCIAFILYVVVINLEKGECPMTSTKNTTTSSGSEKQKPSDNKGTSGGKVKIANEGEKKKGFGTVEVERSQK